MRFGRFVGVVGVENIQPLQKVWNVCSKGSIRSMSSKGWGFSKSSSSISLFFILSFLFLIHLASLLLCELSANKTPNTKRQTYSHPFMQTILLKKCKVALFIFVK
jgi:hypothetical protein